MAGEARAVERFQQPHGGAHLPLRHVVEKRGGGDHLPREARTRPGKRQLRRQGVVVVVDAQRMVARLQVPRAGARDGPVVPVVVHQQRPVEIQARAVVRGEVERVRAVLRDPDVARVAALEAVNELRREPRPRGGRGGERQIGIDAHVFGHERVEVRKPLQLRRPPRGEFGKQPRRARRGCAAGFHCAIRRGSRGASAGVFGPRRVVGRHTHAGNHGAVRRGGRDGEARQPLRADDAVRPPSVSVRVERERRHEPASRRIDAVDAHRRVGQDGHCKPTSGKILRKVDEQDVVRRGQRPPRGLTVPLKLHGIHPKEGGTGHGHERQRPRHTSFTTYHISHRRSSCSRQPTAPLQYTRSERRQGTIQPQACQLRFLIF